jgi:hypothetical protein
MKITPLEKTGNSAKFHVILAKQRGEFMISLSSTLCNIVWQLHDDQATLDAATQLAEAIVSRHDYSQPFKEKYIFGDHNTEETLEAMVKHLRRHAI